MIQEVLSSMRVVKAFAREEYELHRLEEESLENVEIALRARGLKARLPPLVEVIVPRARGWCFGSVRGWSWPALFRGLAGGLHRLSGKNVQTHAGSFEDDGCVFEGRGRLRAYSGVLEMDGEVKDLPGARNGAGCTATSNSIR